MARPPVLKLKISHSLLRGLLGFREVFEIEFCDTPQLAAGSFISSRPPHYMTCVVLKHREEELGYPGRNLATTAAHPRLASKF